jgi:hypothetical protein
MSARRHQRVKLHHLGEQLMHTPAKAVQEGLELRLNQVEGLAKSMAVRVLLDALLSRVLHFPKVLMK